MTPTPPPPRLAITADAQPGYAPISWTAVASLLIGGLFVVLLAVLGLIAFVKKQPLIEVWLLGFPVVAVVLAFVARRQIWASEGTTVGERYANAGWWLGVVSGLGYVAYLFAVDFAIRNDADSAFVEFANNLKAWDPDNPTDEHLYAAFLYTVDPGVRTGADPKKPETLARFEQKELPAFRQIDVVRIVARNRGQVEFKPQGLRDWQQKPTEILCSLTATLTCPEGDFALVLPMRATVDDKKRRRWQIAPPGAEGFVKTASLTPYGRMVESVDRSARQFGNEVLGQLGTDRQGFQAPLAFFAYVMPGFDPRQADAQVRLMYLDHNLPGICGSLAATTGQLWWQQYMGDRVFAAPGGGKLSPENAARMMFCWSTPGRLLRAGGVLQGSSDQAVVSADATGLEARLPVELAIGSEGGQRAAARARIIIRCPASADPKFFADFQAARQAAPTAPRTPTTGANIEDPKLPWRIVRIESDMKPIQPPLPVPGGGMPGGGM